MEATNIIVDYSPYIIATFVFLLRNKIFITPDQLQKILTSFKKDCNIEYSKIYVSKEGIHKVIKDNISENSKLYVTKEEMQKERKDLFQEVEQKFLSIFAFREFEKRIEDHFKMSGERLQKIDENIRFLIENKDK